MHGGKREGAGRKSSGKKKIVMYGTAAEEAMLRKALEEFRQKPKLNAKIKCLGSKTHRLGETIAKQNGFRQWC